MMSGHDHVHPSDSLSSGATRSKTLAATDTEVMLAATNGTSQKRGRALCLDS